MRTIEKACIVTYKGGVRGHVSSLVLVIFHLEIGILLAEGNIICNLSCSYR